MMNIVLATDNNFVQHCSVVISSILSNNSNVNIFLLTEGLSKDNQTYLSDLSKRKGGTLLIKEVPSSIVDRFPMSTLASGHISLATYYRLFVTSLLPNNISKIIYLDCDIVVRGSLQPLWNTNIDQKALAAVYQDQGWSDYNDSWTRLNMPRDMGYFNAGVLLLNLDYLRNIDFENKAISFIKNNYSRIISHDQDVLNAILFDNVVALSPKWNYTPLFLNKRLNKLEFPNFYLRYRDEVYDKNFNPVIIHYVSTPKPWNKKCAHPLRGEYVKYLDIDKWGKPIYANAVIIWFSVVLVNSLRDFLLSVDLFHLATKRKHKKIWSNINIVP